MHVRPFEYLLQSIKYTKALSLILNISTAFGVCSDLFHRQSIGKDLIQQPLSGFHLKAEIGKANSENWKFPLYHVDIQKTWAAEDQNELVNTGD